MKKIIIASIFGCISTIGLYGSSTEHGGAEVKLALPLRRTDVDSRSLHRTQLLLSYCKTEALRVSNFLVEGWLRDGARVNEVDGVGFTPFGYAARFGDVATIRLLCKSGKVDGSMTFGPGYQTALHLAASSTKDPKVVGYMVKAGVDMHAVDRDGKNAAHYAAEKGNLRFLNCLAERGVSLITEDNQGKTPVFLTRSFAPTSESEQRLKKQMLRLAVKQAGAHEQQKRPATVKHVETTTRLKRSRVE